MWYHTRGAKIQWKKYKDWRGNERKFFEKFPLMWILWGRKMSAELCK